MKADEYEKMYLAEKRFWWFVGKGLLVREWAGRYLPGQGSFLDLGCGTGAGLERLSDLGTWAGADPAAEAVRFCSLRGQSRLVRAGAERLPFGEDSFDGIVALDLLEHLEDDRAAVAEAFRVLRPGGVLLVTVPAHPWLWGSHDLAMGHVRRYDNKSMRALLQGAGFTIIRATHFMGLLFPLMVLGKLWQKVLGDPERTVTYSWPAAANWALVSILKIEAGWVGKHSMPAGTTLVAAARKPDRL